VITVSKRYRRTDGHTTYCRITELCVASNYKNCSTEHNEIEHPKTTICEELQQEVEAEQTEHLFHFLAPNGSTKRRVFGQDQNVSSEATKIPRDEDKFVSSLSSTTYILPTFTAHRAVVPAIAWLLSKYLDVCDHGT